MLAIAGRLAVIVPAAFALGAVAITVSQAVSKAAQCGEGTTYDAPSNMCVVAAQVAPPPALPPPQGPPPPPPPPAPHVWVSICAPIRIVSICTGV